MLSKNMIVTIDTNVIIEKGCIVHEGTMDAIWGNDAVIKKYLVL